MRTNRAAEGQRRSLAGGCNGHHAGDSFEPPVHIGYVRNSDDSVPTIIDSAETGVTFDVTPVTETETVLESIETGEFDCVLSRYRLDETTGIDLLERVRDRFCDVPFVLLARDGSEQIASEAIAAGVSDYVPFDSESALEDELVDRLSEMLDRHSTCVATDQLEGVEAAVEHAADAIVVTDTDGTIEYVNPAFEAVTGYTREEAVDSNPRILKSGHQGEEYYEEMWETILEGDVWEEEIINERKSGERYVAHQTVAPVTDRTGSIRKFVGIQRDVTIQRRLEEQIDRTAMTLSRVYDVTSDTELGLQERMEAVLDIGSRHLEFPVGYVTRIEDETQTVLAASGDHELIQAGAEDPLGRTYCRRTVTQDEPLIIDDAAEAGWQDDPAFERFGLRCYVGATVQVDGERFGTLCFGGEQAREEMVLSAVESTVEVLANWLGYEIERHRNKWELEQKNERLEEFASIVSHDLRNPLNVAMLRLSKARESNDPDGDLSAVADAHERMANIIEDTLTLARKGTMVEETSPVSLGTLAEECWGSVETADATLEVREDVTVEGDPDRIRHIFENLFRNSVEHGSTGNRPEADDSVEHAGSDVTVWVGQTDTGFYVADDGPGIDPDTQAAVFRSGFSTSESGTGFGLAIVERIAEAHGWSVTCTESERGGVRFEFETGGTDDRVIEPLLSRDR